MKKSNIKNLKAVYKKENIGRIIEWVIECSEKMVKDFIYENNKIENKEDKISSYLSEIYLDKNSMEFRFQSQFSLNYDKKKCKHIGCVDIAVTNREWHINRDNYYLIECKRIDGDYNLNYKYVSEGILRFVVSPIKYPSFHNKNIMLGFIVKNINVPENTNKINAIQSTTLNSYVKETFSLQTKDEPKSWIYSSLYHLQDKTDLELKHIFYNFSPIINSNMK